MVEIVGAPATTDSERFSARDKEIAERKSAVIKSRMSPKGLLGLPQKLDDARLQYGITDAAFRVQAVYDRVLVWQVAMQEGETYEGSKIIMAEVTKHREKVKAPIGIIVSAGLLALDVLRSNGMDLGHKVIFTHAAPYFVRYDVVEGQDYHLIVLYAGNITASYDLADDLRTRAVRIVQNPAQSETPEHVLIDHNGKAVLPQKVDH
jgi:hypothetical protein